MLVDIHCHILPGVDDGATDMETSKTMIREAYKQGDCNPALQTGDVRTFHEQGDKCISQNAHLCSENWNRPSTWL